MITAKEMLMESERAIENLVAQVQNHMINVARKGHSECRINYGDIKGGNATTLDTLLWVLKAHGYNVECGVIHEGKAAMFIDWSGFHPEDEEASNE